MKSAKLGTSTLAVEVTSVSGIGFWLLLGERELFLPFAEFPWFRDATIAQLTKVELPAPQHLYWPDLDVDLTVESIEHPDQYPLVSHRQEGASPAGSQPDRRGVRAARGVPDGRR